METSQLESIFIKASQKAVKSREAIVKPGALVASFNDLSNITTAENLLNTVISSKFERHGDYLIAFYDDVRDTKSDDSTLSSLLQRFTSEIAALPFEPDWLETYMTYKQLGIDHVGTSPYIRKPEEIEEFLQQRAKDKEQGKAYDDKLSAAMAYAESIDESGIESQFAKYIKQEWICDLGDSQIDTLAADIIRICNSFASGRWHMSEFPCQDIDFALDDKSSAIADHALSEYNKLDDAAKLEKKMLKLQARHSRVDAFGQKARHERDSMHKMWDECRRTIKKALPKTLTVKGLDALLEDEEAKVQVEPFGFADFSHHGTYDLQWRLSPQNLRYCIQEQADTLQACVAGGLAAYYLYICELKHDAAYKAGLIELSKRLDQVDLSEERMKIAEQTMPVK